MTPATTSPLCAPSVLDGWLAGHCGLNPATDDLAARLPHALRAAQQERLRSTLAHARAHSALYRRRLQGVDPYSISLADLPFLPFTHAEDLTRWTDVLCVSQDSIQRMVTLETSGTTAAPKKLAFTKADLAATRDFFQVGMSQLVRPGQTVLVLWPGAARPHGVSGLLRQALEAQDITVVAGFPLPTAESLRQELTRHDPHTLVAAPRQLAVLLDMLAAAPAGFRENLRLSGVLSSAEMLPADLNRRLNEDFNLHVLDHYGMTETGYGGGVECPAHAGYHLRELDLLVEVVEVNSGLPLPPGALGEVVVTTLGREAMPLIRYRTGDAACLLAGPCACGSPLRRLGRVQGRIVRTPSGYHIENTAKGAFYERSAHLTL